MKASDTNVDFPTDNVLVVEAHTLLVVFVDAWVEDTSNMDVLTRSVVDRTGDRIQVEYMD